MLPKKLLYNSNDFQINPLIRGAHPYGGTEVISTESGEGMVEDLIENQQKMLEMVFRQPTLKTLANLANFLDSDGLHSLATQVDKLLEKFAVAAPLALSSFPVGMLSSSYGLAGAAAWPALAGVAGIAVGTVINRFIEDNIQNLLDTYFGTSIWKASFELIKDDFVKIKELLSKSGTVNDIIEAQKIFIRTRNMLFVLSQDKELRSNRSALGRVLYLEKQWDKIDKELGAVLGKGMNIPSSAISKDSPGSNESFMAQVQEEVNRIMGQSVVPVNGNVGDPTTWEVIKKDLNLHAPQDFSNYRQLLTLLQNIEGKAGSATVTKPSPEVAKSRSQEVPPPREEDRRATTHVRFNWQGKDVEFPIARAIRQVDIRDSQAMAKAAVLFTGWLRNLNIVLPQVDVNNVASIESMAMALTPIIAAIKEGIPTDGTNPTYDEKFGSVFGTIIQYIYTIQEYYRALADAIREQAARQKEHLKNKPHILDFLRAEFSHPGPNHPLSLVEKSPAARQQLLNWLASKELSNSDGIMIAVPMRVTNRKAEIETQLKNYVRNYGLQ